MVFSLGRSLTACNSIIGAGVAAVLIHINRNLHLRVLQAA